MYQSTIEGLFLLITVDKCMGTYRSSHKDVGPISKAMAFKKFFDFLKGQDDKSSMTSRKDEWRPRAWNSERAAEYRDLIQAIGTLRTKQQGGP